MKELDGFRKALDAKDSPPYLTATNPDAMFYPMMHAASMSLNLAPALLKVAECAEAFAVVTVLEDPKRMTAAYKDLADALSALRSSASGGGA